MAANIIDGKKIAETMRNEIREEVIKLKKCGVTPGLGVILVGDNPASKSYVTAKEKACMEAEMYSEDNRLPATTSQEELIAHIKRLNNDPRIHGILLQLPLPKHMNESEAIMAIAPEKDVDGFHPVNVGKMVIGEKTFLPCTPHGVVKLLEKIKAKVSGSHVVVVGRSNIVGKPVAILLMQKKENANATVTVCHTGTKNMAYFTRQADILIVAAGKPNTINADMIKEEAIVIDVGVNRIEDHTKKTGFRLVGDVDFDSVTQKASWITPVPGGVGPMTITMLLYNTLESARNFAEVR